MRKRFTQLHRRCAALLRDDGGVAFVEFGYALPFLMILGLGGIELANYSISHMRVAQLAVSLADNASRAKQEVVSGVPRMREYDVNETFRAAQLQSGPLDIKNHGTLILSSLEVNPDGGQWIHWQRCYGKSQYTSSWGLEGDGATGTDFPGMGPAGRVVQADDGFAVMFVEVIYEYDSLIFDRFISENPIHKVAAMYVRDDRDLSALYNPDPAAPVSNCGA